jgi:hypothetical protein
MRIRTTLAAALATAFTAGLAAQSGVTYVQAHKR